MNVALLASIIILVPSAAFGADSSTRCYSAKEELFGNGQSLGYSYASASIANDDKSALVSFSVSMPDSGQVLGNEKIASTRIAPNSHEFRFLDGWGNQGKGTLVMSGKHASLILEVEKVNPGGNNILRNYGKYNLSLSQC
jgi:hypothetical protein